MSESLSSESGGIKKSNTNPVDANPTLVVPTPVITPNPPEYSTPFICSVSNSGGAIKTTGGLVNVYPDPAEVTLTEVTAVPVIEAVAVALVVDPNPTGLARVTKGAAV